MCDQQRPFIGCTLSLVSKAKIRYTGTLASIDTVNTTLTLHKVQSHGTEERLKDKCIAPTPGTYDLIIFNGHDIEDLQVVPKEETIQDPAILNAQKHKDHEPIHPQHHPGTIGVAPATLKGSGGGARQPPQRGPNLKEAGAKMGNNMHQLGHDADHSAFSKPGAPFPRENHTKSGADPARRPAGPPSTTSSNRGPSEAQLRRAEQAKKRQQQLEKFKEDFDWTSGHAKFDVLKEELAKEMEAKLTLSSEKAKKSRKRSKESDKASSKDGETPEKAEEDVEVVVKEDGSEGSDDEDSDANAYYQPKLSFFDSISCEATEGRGNEGPRMNRFQERKLNAETFGIPEHPNYRGRGRGRGAYRGGNRGGYQQNRYQGGERYNDRYQGGGGGGRYENRDAQGGYGRPRYNQYNNNNGYQANRRYGNQGNQWSGYNNGYDSRPRQMNAQ